MALDIRDTTILMYHDRMNQVWVQDKNVTQSTEHAYSQVLVWACKHAAPESSEGLVCFMYTLPH